MKPFLSPETSIGTLDAELAGTLLSASADLALVIDSEGIVRDIAIGSDELQSEGLEAWVGQSWSDTVTPESRNKVAVMLREAAGTPRWRQLNQRTPSGVDMPVLYSVVSVQRSGGSGGGNVVAFGRDLAATAALQQRLVDAQQAMERDYWRFRHAETRYRHLFQVSGEAVLIVDAATQKVVEANPAAVKLLGTPGRGWPGRPFPEGLDSASSDAVTDMLMRVRATGRAEETRAELADAGGTVLVSASLFRQEGATRLLVRIARMAAPVQSPPQEIGIGEMLAGMVRAGPDAVVLTDAEGKVITANPAFIELAQLPSEHQARGESLDSWLGRTGVDLSVLLNNLRQRGSVRMFATTLRGELGSTTEVEVCGSMIPHGASPFIGLVIRDVGRRLAADPRIGKELPRSVGQLTELVGRVPLKDIVGETTDLIEQLCIEAALELTRDNRASAAEMLGLSRQSLYVKLRRYGLGDLGVENASTGK